MKVKDFWKNRHSKKNTVDKENADNTDFVSRTAAKKKFEKEYIQWAKGENSGKIYIKADPFSGTTTFLLKDIRPIVDVNWLYFDCNSNQRENDELDILICWRNQLARNHIHTPYFDYALNKYDELTGHSLRHRDLAEEEFSIAEAFQKGDEGSSDLGAVASTLNTVAGMVEGSVHGASNGATAVSNTNFDACQSVLSGLAEGFESLAQLNCAVACLIQAGKTGREIKWKLKNQSYMEVINNTKSSRELKSSLDSCFLLDILKSGKARQLCFVIDGYNRWSIDCMESSSYAPGRHWLIGLAECLPSCVVFAGAENPSQPLYGRGLKALESIGLDDLDVEEIMRIMHTEDIEMARALQGYCPKAAAIADFCAKSCSMKQENENLVEKIGKYNTDDTESNGDDPFWKFYALVVDVFHMLDSNQQDLIYTLSWFDPWTWESVQQIVHGTVSHIQTLHDLIKKSPFIVKVEGDVERYTVAREYALIIQNCCSTRVASSLEKSFKKSIAGVSSTQKTEIFKALLRIEQQGVNRQVNATDRNPSDAFNRGMRDGAMSPQILAEWCEDVIPSVMIQGKNVIESYIRVLDAALELYASQRGTDLDASFKGVAGLVEIWEDFFSNLNLLENTKGDKKEYLEWRAGVERRNVAALLQCGAISSDKYRASSNIVYHISALTYELKALRKAYDFISSQDVSLISKSLINVAVSCYRIQRYDIALPLSRVAYEFSKIHKNEVKEKGRYNTVLRNCAAIRYSAAVDGYSTLHTTRDDLLNAAKDFSEQELETKPENTWISKIRRAACIMQLSSSRRESADALRDLDEATSEIRKVLKEIQWKREMGTIGRPYVREQEAERYLSQICERKARLCDDRSEKSDLLKEALKHVLNACPVKPVDDQSGQSEDSLERARKVCDEAKEGRTVFPVDVRKDLERIQSLQAKLTRISDSDGNDSDFAEDRLDADSTLNPDKWQQQLGEHCLHRWDSLDEYAYILVEEVVNRIVRRDPNVNLDMIFGKSSTDWKKHLGLDDEFDEFDEAGESVSAKRLTC